MAAAPLHECEVLASPWPGVYAAVVRSERHYGRHSHGTFGFGFVEHGAHRSCSGRGTVDAHAGQIVTTNPGEVHDGRPLGGASRSWCTVYVEPQVLRSLEPAAAGDIEITRPVFVDAALQRSTRRLLGALRRWQQGAADALACEEAWWTPAGCWSRGTRRAAPRMPAGARRWTTSAGAWPTTCSPRPRWQNWRRTPG